MRRSTVVVHSILLELRRSVIRRESELKKRGNILNLCSLIKVR
jgi:hypothetical protein